MSFSEIMHAYFRGEKLEAACFILPVGLLFLGLAYGAWRSETGGFMWGVIVPSVVVGLLLVGVGASVAGRTNGQVSALEKAYEADPQAMVREELPRMRKVEDLFRTTLPIFGVVTVLGLGLRFGVRVDWAVGLGAVLIAAGGAGLLIDGFASRRSTPYVAALEALQTAEAAEAFEDGATSSASSEPPAAE